ncbi:type III-B CRISPR module RAMP protein Cmr4 [Nautilia lithotrophica]
MRLFILENLTNMHVGSGDINFGVVDNLVQKDPVTNLPVIHSSSLKGALREYFEDLCSKDEITYIFGQDPDNSDMKNPGAYSFFEAKLLTLPVRSNVELYFNAISDKIIEEFLDYFEFVKESDNITKIKKAFNELKNSVSNEILYFDEYTEEVYVEDEKAKKGNISKESKEVLEKFLGRFVLYPHNLFENIDLPFIARNKLNEDGTSDNLWYEEIVPKRSKFYFFIKEPKNLQNNKVKEFNEVFEKVIKNKELIQFGANKSIGYGFSTLKEIK